MSDMAIIAWCLGCAFVISLAFLTVAIGCCDSLRQQLLRERAQHAARYAELEAHAVDQFRQTRQFIQSDAGFGGVLRVLDAQKRNPQ